MLIRGEFTVAMEPKTSSIVGESGQFANFKLSKEYFGELTAASIGEMQSLRTHVAQSAGYVALEQVSGSLQGKQGSFALQHFGLMDQGKDELILKVIPDSGTEELAGITGSMNIIIENGKHFYEFEFEL